MTTILKGFLGALLSTIALNFNCEIFPLAICICEVKNSETWGYFISLLHKFLGDLKPIIFISDSQKGWMNVLENHWPTARNMHCVRYVVG